MARRLKFDIPGPDWRVGLEQIAAGGWEGVFGADLPRPLRLVVEIGFGRGEFLMAEAGQRPAVAHVGVEYSAKRVLKMARRLARTPLRNVRLVHAMGERVVREALAPGSVEAFWINFPDPWPKQRHHRRRLLSPDFVAALARCLRPGGSLHVATDHAGYAEVIDTALAGEGRLENANAPDRWRREVAERRPTAYELEWRREGRSLFFWEYRRRSAGCRAVDGVDTPAARP